MKEWIGTGGRLTTDFCFCLIVKASMTKVVKETFIKMGPWSVEYKFNCY